MAKTRKADKDRNYPGRGTLRCKICGRPYTSHETMDFCTDGKPVTIYVMDKEGRRRRVRKT